MPWLSSQLIYLRRRGKTTTESRLLANRREPSVQRKKPNTSESGGRHVPPFFSRMDRFKPRDRKALHETVSNGGEQKFTSNHRKDEPRFSGSSEGKSPRTVEIFQSLDYPERRSPAFGASLIVHVVLLVV